MFYVSVTGIVEDSGCPDRPCLRGVNEDVRRPTDGNEVSRMSADFGDSFAYCNLYLAGEGSAKQDKCQLCPIQ